MKNRVLLLGILLSFCILTSCKKEEKKEWEKYYSASIDELLGTFKGSGTYYQYEYLNDGTVNTTTANSNDVTVTIQENRTNVSFSLIAPNVYTAILSGAIYSGTPFIALTNEQSNTTYSPDNQSMTETKSGTTLNCDILKNTDNGTLRYEGSAISRVTVNYYEKNSYGTYVLISSDVTTPSKFTFVVEK